MVEGRIFEKGFWELSSSNLVRFMQRNVCVLRLYDDRELALCLDLVWKEDLVLSAQISCPM